MSIYYTFILALLNITSVRASRVLLSLYALELGAQPFAIGILAATFSALPMLLSWQAGFLIASVPAGRSFLALPAAPAACWCRITCPGCPLSM